MEPQNTSTTQAANGATSGQADASRQSREIADTYERARRELNDAVARLRQEIEQIDVARARQSAQDWVTGNPTLATFLAIGGGIVLGRLISSTARQVAPPPRTFPEQLRDRAGDYASVARDYADDIGKAIATGAAIASAAVASRVAEAGGTVVRRAAGVGEVVTDRVQDLTHDIGKRAHQAASAMQEDAHDLSKALRKKVRRRKPHSGIDFGDTLAGAAKTVVAALLIKRITQFVKDLS